MMPSEKNYSDPVSNAFQYLGWSSDFGNSLSTTSTYRTFNSLLQGEYTRLLFANESNGEPFGICEVRAYAEKNIATPETTVIADGANPSGPLQHRLSGNKLNPDYSCFTSAATSGSGRNWIIDLGESKLVEGVVYIGPQNTADISKGHNIRFYVEETQTERNNECLSSPTTSSAHPGQGTVAEIDCKLSGRYVILEKDDTT